MDIFGGKRPDNVYVPPSPVVPPPPEVEHKLPLPEDVPTTSIPRLPDYQDYEDEDEDTSSRNLLFDYEERIEPDDLRTLFSNFLKQQELNAKGNENEGAVFTLNKDGNFNGRTFNERTKIVNKGDQPQIIIIPQGFEDGHRLSSEIEDMCHHFGQGKRW